MISRPTTRAQRDAVARNAATRPREEAPRQAVPRGRKLGEALRWDKPDFLTIAATTPWLLTAMGHGPGEPERED